MNLSIRDLYNQIIKYSEKNTLNDVLIPWIEENDYKNYLNQLSEQLVNNNDISLEDSWELYALSRVLEIITLKFQPNNRADGSDWLGSEIEISAYKSFAENLGLQIVNNSDYHPFYCEIFEAIEGNTNFLITEMFLPPLMLGNLLIKRGGVKVELNPLEYDLNLVNKSTIYWTYRRKNRKYQDLSHGWGSNSQWRTSFRFDFDLGDSFVYNSEGKINLNSIDDSGLKDLGENNLLLEEAIEITKNRHFISCGKLDSDLFPYEFRYSESKTI